MKKRLLATLLALAMVCALLPTVALAAASGFTIEDSVLTAYDGPGGDVVIPDGVTGIGDYAFNGCKSVTSITIPEGVTSIGEGAFIFCTSLTSFTVAQGNPAYTSLDGVLFNKNRTTLVQYPAGRAGAYVIPESVTSIGGYAFSDCTGLTSITIPEGVTSIGERAFSDCNLTSFTVAQGNPAYTSLDGVLFNKNITTLIQCPAKKAGAYVIPEGVTSIGDYAFAGCTSLTSVTIPEGVTSIGDYAFPVCTSLTSVTIPEGVTNIGKWAFSFCNSLTSITIPKGVTSIGDGAFAGCESLTSITIPAGVTSMGNFVFQNCTGLTSITILEGVTTIGRYAFSGCGSLTGITIPKGVTSIGNFAFYRCESLTSITVPAGVTSIGTGAFSFCNSLTSITIPAGMTSIGTGAFSACESLTSVTIPASMTSIGGSAFQNCDNLTVYGYAGTEAERYCAENDIPFVAVPGIASGTAQEGTLENGEGKTLTWAMTEQGQLAVIGQSTAGGLVLAACYDQTGRMTDVKMLTAQSITAQLDPATPTVKLFWLGAKQNPLSPSVTVWGK